MALTKEQILLIRNSWKSFRGVNPSLIADIFYTKLFADNPRLRKMFPDNMNDQYKKLMDMLTSIVIRLDSLEEMGAELELMARQHVGYGVKPRHYDLVGNALLWTLEQSLGGAWNKELKDAWAACYTLLANKMMMAAPH